ncbi:amino acid ABC transporter ATP-binding protein (PAAT family) [Propionicimonas paludicola]|uniref:Amino acid ABC transporter ATP-binding protein (PAAT family) n=1 Tax=Propionicimonas paludicola TaxID=185243 RepID=A0A2A9CTZ0_9ACTN|nr:amino acid ABC transporter ATP-binding protein [Propionicimonas paludicola]PFG17601.1 amino acid ABC transporter ATP-binding protein (PAAT family) [Propionicimonas paludicola]
MKPHSHSVQIRNVSKRYGSLEVLRQVSLDVEANTVTCILGPSGSGKSTLLRAINHLISIDSGVIRVSDEVIGYEQRDNRLFELSDRDLCRQRSHIGMVFQSFNLFPHLTVLENVTCGLITVRRAPKADAIATAQHFLDRVGLAHKAGAYPAQLSGGQQQRVAIARALAMQPRLILFDEPTSALDPELVGEVLTVIRELAESSDTTMIVVTHEIGFAREVADQIVFMDEGRVAVAGSVAEVFGSDSPRIRAFLDGNLK